MTRFAWIIVFACSASLVLGGCTQGAEPSATGTTATSTAPGTSTESTNVAPGSSAATNSAGASASGTDATEGTSSGDTADDAAKAKEAEESELADPTTAGTVTLAASKKIKNGMTYDKVVAILGKPTVKAGEVTFDGTKVATYGWMGAGSMAAVLSVTFTDGKVTATEQRGLE